MDQLDAVERQFPESHGIVCTVCPTNLSPLRHMVVQPLVHGIAQASRKGELI